MSIPVYNLSEGLVGKYTKGFAGDEEDSKPVELGVDELQFLGEGIGVIAKLSRRDGFYSPLEERGLISTKLVDGVPQYQTTDRGEKVLRSECEERGLELKEKEFGGLEVVI